MVPNDSANDANADAEAALRYFIRNGIPFGIVAKTNEEQLQHHYEQEKQAMQTEMVGKVKFVSALISILVVLVTVTVSLTRTSNAAEEARAEVKNVEVRLNEKVGEASGAAKSAQDLAQDLAIKNGQQDAEILALKEDSKYIRDRLDKLVEMVARIERDVK